jgi:hypothetical protein
MHNCTVATDVPIERIPIDALYYTKLGVIAQVCVGAGKHEETLISSG